MWTSALQDGSGNGVYQQVYGAGGNAVGSETLVNSYTAGNQAPLKVTALSDGGWVVTWNSNGQDGDGDGIYQKVFHLSGSHAPFGTNVNIVTDAGVPYTFSALSFPFNDADGDTLQAVLIDTITGSGTLKLNGVNVTAGQTVLASDLGNLVWSQPTGSGTGHSSITFSIIDNGSIFNGGVNKDATPNTMTFNINPQVANPLADQSVVVGNNLSFTIPTGALAAFSDYDGDTLTYSALQSDGIPLPGWLKFNTKTGEFSGIPDTGNIGTVSVVVTATDGNGGTITDQFDVKVKSAGTNPATIFGTSTANIGEDDTGTVEGDLGVFDADPDKSFFADTYDQDPSLLEGLYGTFTFNSTDGIWTYKIRNTDPVVQATVQALNTGETLFDSITVKSLDLSASKEIKVTIIGANESANNVPTVTGTFIGAVTEDAVPNTAGGTVTFNDPDPGESKAAPATGATTYGTYTVDEVGNWVYTLNNADAKVQALGNGDMETDTFFINSKDLSASQSITITIIGKNDAPELVASQAALANGTEDVNYLINRDDLLVGFKDAEDDDLSVTNLTSNHGTIVDNLDGTFTLIPTQNYKGFVTLNYTVDDGNGGTVAATNNSLFLVNVNDAPIVATPIADTSAIENSAFNYTIPKNTFFDPDLNLLTFTYSGMPAWLSVEATGLDFVFTGTPGGGDLGPVTITITASDGSLSVDEDFVIDVKSDNIPPVLIDDQAVLGDGTEDVAYIVTAEQLLTGFSDPDGDIPFVTNVTSDHGMVTDNLDGTYTLVPDKNYNGAVVFSYTVNNAEGGTLAATLATTLAPVNDAPELVGPQAVLGQWHRGRRLYDQCRRSSGRVYRCRERNSTVYCRVDRRSWRHHRQWRRHVYACS